MGLEYSAGFLHANSRQIRRLALSMTPAAHLVAMEMARDFQGSSKALVTKDNRQAYKDTQQAGRELDAWAIKMAATPKKKTCKRGWYLKKEISEENHCTDCTCWKK